MSDTKMPRNGPILCERHHTPTARGQAGAAGCPGRIVARAQRADREPAGATLPDPPFAIHREDRDGRRVLRLSGDVDLSTSPEVVEALNVACVGTARVEVDLSGVRFMDSSGLHALVSARRRADRDGCALVVGPVSDEVRQVLELTHTLDWLASG
jgi:anti-anti-sigma factor